MKQLQYLRNQLIQLRRYRQWLRWATAISAAVIVVLMVLAAVFALDWCFQRNEDRWQRLFLLTAGAVAIGWAARRYALPWLSKREDPLEIALLVQRYAGLESDLVAALQFESPEARQWGSVQLETAVIERVSSGQKGIKVMAALESQPMLKRLRMLGVVAAVWIAVGLLFPSHVGVFFSRLLLGSQHYPTHTRIVGLTINGKSVDLLSPETTSVRVPYGRAVKFEVQTTGVRPTEGRVELIGSGKTAVVNLAKPADVAEDEAPIVYQGTHARLIQTARYQVFVGDAFTDSLVLEVTQPPIITVQPEVMPPAYARDAGEEVQVLPRGMSQFAVIEGSEVRLKVHADRPVKSVVLTVQEKPIALVLQKEDPSDEGQIWAPSTEGTPLAAVTEPLRYSIQVSDADDQPLEQPLEGFIRIKPDLPPRIAAVTKTSFVLPSARPTIYYGATDDHALSRIWLTAEVLREGAAAAIGSTQEETEVYKLADKAAPQAKQEGTYSLNLAPLHLTQGDTLKVTLHATDYRGQRKGKTSDAEPLVFHVTDEQGVLSSMLEGDQRSARELESAIKRLLGTGDSP
ncbi:MAG: hypothetical protein WCJ35_07885 [Planctomycetota bacterium]